MKVKLKLLFAVVVIVAAGYWAVTTVIPYTYSGSNVMFPVGGGHVVITNPGEEAIPIEMRSEGRTGSFRIASTDLDLTASSKRQGSGRNVFYATSFDLPPGEARIEVTRGSDVYLVSRADTTIQAVVTPRAPTTVRWILIFSGAAMVWALYYMSSVTEHRWLALLRNRQSGEPLQPKKTAA